MLSTLTDYCGNMMVMLGVFLLHNYSWNILDAQVLSLMVIAVAIALKDEFCRTLTTVHSHLAEQDLRECKDC